MRMPTFFLPPPTVLAVTLGMMLTLCSAASQAQAPAPMPPAANPPSRSVDQRIERLRVEDEGVVVEELRVGGQTESTTVTPKANVPAYEIQPPAGSRTRSQAGHTLDAGPGQRVWNVLKF